MTESFRKLKVWQEGVSLSVLVYEVTKGFPKEEIYGLTSQMRRCAVSVPSNIAEGSARGTKKDFLSFLRIATGSLRELETQFEVCRRIGYADDMANSKIQVQIDVVSKLLTRLVQSLEEA